MSGAVATTDGCLTGTTLPGCWWRCGETTRQLRCDGRLQPTQQQIKPALQGDGGVGVRRRGSCNAMDYCDPDETRNSVDDGGFDGVQTTFSN